MQLPLYYIHFEILICKPEIVSSFTKTHTLPGYSPERRSVATTQMCSDQCCANIDIGILYLCVQMCLYKILLQKIVENLKEVIGLIKNKSRIK